MDERTSRIKLTLKRNHNIEQEYIDILSPLSPNPTDTICFGWFISIQKSNSIKNLATKITRRCSELELRTPPKRYLIFEFNEILNYFLNNNISVTTFKKIFQ